MNAGARTGRAETGVGPDEKESARAAVERLIHAHGAQLFVLGQRFCGNREDAEDLVQETFLRAYDKWDTFRGESKPSTWLYAIAARVCRRKRRRRAGEPERIASLDELLPLDEPSMAVVSDDPAEAASARAAALPDVEAAIAALPERFRMPFVLQEIVGFAPAEVAAITGLAPATVRTRVHRARLKIRAAAERRLPRRALPPVAFSRTVCLDLLRAKQEALDRGQGARLPDAAVCARCSAFFATLDLTSDVCRELSRGELPATLMRQLEAELAAR